MSCDLIEEINNIVVAMSAESSKILIEHIFLVKLDKILLLDSVNLFSLFRDKLSLFLLNVRKKFSLWVKISF